MNPKDQIHYDIAELLEKIAHLNIKLASTAKIHPVELDLLRSYLRELDKLADSMPLMQLPKPVFAPFQSETAPSSLPSFNTPEDAKTITEPALAQQVEEPIEAAAPLWQETQVTEPEAKQEETAVPKWEEPVEETTVKEPSRWSWESEPVIEKEQEKEKEEEKEEGEDEQVAIVAEEQEEATSLPEETDALEDEQEEPEIAQPEATVAAEPEAEEEIEWIKYGEADRAATPEPQPEPEEKPWIISTPEPVRIPEPETVTQAEPEREPEQTPAYRDPWVKEEAAKAPTVEEPKPTAPLAEEPKAQEPVAPLFTPPAQPPSEPTPSTEEPVKRSINDMFNRSESQELGSRFQFQNRKNLREMIDLSERYIFTKELFGGDADYYDRAIRQLNQFETLAEAQAYMNNDLKPKYNWGGKEQVEKQFSKIVERRFA